MWPRSRHQAKPPDHTSRPKSERVAGRNVKNPPRGLVPSEELQRPAARAFAEQARTERPRARLRAELRSASQREVGLVGEFSKQSIFYLKEALCGFGALAVVDEKRRQAAQLIDRAHHRLDGARG